MAVQKSDLDLVEALKAGDQSGYEELINRYAEKAYSLAARLTRSPEDAEEVLQDVFVSDCTGWQRFRIEKFLDQRVRVTRRQAIHPDQHMGHAIHVIVVLFQKPIRTIACTDQDLTAPPDIIEEL